MLFISYRYFFYLIVFKNSQRTSKKYTKTTKYYYLTFTIQNWKNVYWYRFCSVLIIKIAFNVIYQTWVYLSFLSIFGFTSDPYNAITETCFSFLISLEDLRESNIFPNVMLKMRVKYIVKVINVEDLDQYILIIDNRNVKFYDVVYRTGWFYNM